MTGRTISHYHVLEKLGQGGMGVVYKAQDARLDRVVALKFLAPHLVSHDDVRKRFIREAKTAAALQHPNICTVYEIDDSGGRTFISMAYLEGRELAEEIACGLMDMHRALELGIQLADGLAEAHSRGIVHRDIKPANLFVTNGGRGVILDFGLAQLASADSKLTREGSTLGTCAYMSPEQATGAEVDARADVWALGCVLYEMLAGHAPFRGHYEQAVVYSILNEEPEPLPASMGRLGDVVRHCLAKQPAERYRDGSELAAALRTALTPEAVPPPQSSVSSESKRTSVVVLPFQNRSGSEDDEYFSDGVTEDIITTIGKIKELRVIPRSSAFHFKGKRPQLHEIVEALDVSHVLEGSIRRAGDRVRINVELVSTADGDQVWTERYDRVLEDIFDVQDEIAKAIAEQLTIELISGKRLLAKPTSNEQAYQLYLRGKHLVYRLTGDGLHQGIELLKQARELDATFARAYAVEAFAHNALSVCGWATSSEGFEQGKLLAQRAIEIDDGLAEARLSRGHSLMFIEWDWPGAEAAMRTAMAQDPENPDVQSALAELLFLVGRFDDSVAAARRARELDPLSVEAIREEALAYLFQRNYAASVHACRQLFELDPNHPHAHAYVGIAQSLAGDHTEAVGFLRKAAASLGYEPQFDTWFGYVLGRAGHADEAREILAKLRTRQKEGLPSWIMIAGVHVGLGETEEALAAYEAGVSEHEGLAVYTTSPIWDPIRDDPRFRALRRRMNLE